MIPKRFKLFGSTVNVHISDRDFTFNQSENDACAGWARYRTNDILLRPNDNQDIIEQTFWHEFSHFILYHAGNAFKKGTEWPHKCETFVDLHGLLLMQAINSFEYEEER